jgi:hypothetical protein
MKLLFGVADPYPRCVRRCTTFLYVEVALHKLEKVLELERASTLVPSLD